MPGERARSGGRKIIAQDDFGVYYREVVRSTAAEAVLRQVRVSLQRFFNCNPGSPGIQRVRMRTKESEKIESTV